jgi:hypothetical protein
MRRDIFSVAAQIDPVARTGMKRSHRCDGLALHAQLPQRLGEPSERRATEMLPPRRRKPHVGGSAVACKGRPQATECVCWVAGDQASNIAGWDF